MTVEQGNQIILLLSKLQLYIRCAGWLTGVLIAAFIAWCIWKFIILSYFRQYIKF